MSYPSDLKYSAEHEWIRVEGARGTVGITAFAVEQIGDIVFVELPAVGTTLAQLATFGVVESVKAVSDCYAPVSGKVLEANDPLSDNPETINEDCYGEGWMIRVEMSDPGEVKQLMDHKAYGAFLEEETA